MYHLDELLPTNIFYSKRTNQNMLLSAGNTHFLHTQKLMQHLVHVQPVITDERNELIHRCLQQYQNNPKELRIVEKFDKTYSASQSMRWYTRHSFLYRLLNKALRMQHLDMILLLRFFIFDIAEVLHRKKQPSATSSSVRLFRAQDLSKKELEILMKSLGEFISIGTFLWASPQHDQSRSKLTLSDDLEPVLFEIYVDLPGKHGNVFPNVTKNDETFFMIGSIFRLGRIERDTDGIWNIQLALCSEKDPPLQEIFHCISNHLADAKEGPLLLGFLLEEMSKLDDATRYVDRILQHLPKDHEDIARCYHALGEITQKQGHFDSSLKWFKKSLELDMKLLKRNETTIATGHNSIAVVYSKKGDYAHALESFSKALEIWKKSHGEEDLDVAMCLNNIGIICQEQKKYLEALEYYQKAWSIRQNILPVEHPSLGQSHWCIGNVHYYLTHYDLALEHFKLSLEISRRSLFPHHPGIALILRNIGLVYQKKGEGEQALAYMKQAATLFRHSVPSTNPDLMQIEQIIHRMTAK